MSFGRLRLKWITLLADPQFRASVIVFAAIALGLIVFGIAYLLDR